MLLLALAAGPAAALMGAADPEPPTCTDPAPKTVRTNPRAPLTLLASCRDASNLGVTMVIEQAPSHGTLETNPNSPYAVAYSPEKDFAGDDAFTYHVTSANGASNTVEQAITVDPSYNQAPWCNHDVRRPGGPVRLALRRLLRS